MKTRRLARVRLWVEELETRVVPSTVTSTNWSGYAALPPTGATVTAVSADWTVPTASETGTNTTTSYSSFWVGIDGYSSSTVEQIGTDSDIINGHATYYAWYEMYPRPYYTIAMTVTPGDTISASVASLGSNKFALQLTDVTTGATSNVPTQTLSGAKLSSAEWIAEAPSGQSVLPLANFGTVNFTNASATINTVNNGQPAPISAFNYNAIDMATSRGVAEATPSALDSTGTSFSVMWDSSGVAAKGHGKGGSHSGGDGGYWHSNLNTQGYDQGGLAAAGAQSMPLADLTRNLAADLNFNAAPPATSFNPQAFPPTAGTFQAGNGALGISRLGSFGASDADLLDVPVPPQLPQIAPAPAAAPMPNRDLRPAVPAPMPMQAPMPTPMQQDNSPRQDSTPAIIDAEVALRDVPAPANPARSSGWLKSIVYLIGGAGAFALFGNSAYANGRDEHEQDRRIRPRVS